MTSVWKRSLPDKLIYIIFCAGMLLSLLQYIFNRSLWMDEAALSLDLINDTSPMLLKGLANGQVAPILYLQIEHAFALLLPNTEYGLRLFPLLCYWASMYLFYKILRHTFTDKFVILFALSLYVFDGTLVYYSSEVKQYITDVTVAMAIYYFVVKDYRHEGNRYILLAVIGAFGIFLSNVSPILLSCAGLYLIIEYLKNKRNLWPLLITFGTWAVVFAVYFFCFEYHHPLKDLMLAYWTKANGFMPLDKRTGAWVINKFAVNFCFQLYCGPLAAALLAMLLFTGLFYILKKRSYTSLILLVLPLLLHLLLSGFKIYPFDTRLVLYSTPLLIIIMAWGMLFVLQLLESYFKTATFKWAIVAIPVLLVCFIRPLPIILHDNLRACISYMKIRLNSTDNVYVTVSAAYQLQYYQYINYLITVKPVLYSGYIPRIKAHHKDEITALKKLKGRIWVFSLPRYHEDALIKKVLDSAGYRQALTYTTNGIGCVTLFVPGK
jgi:hypothetical protein